MAEASDTMEKLAQILEEMADDKATRLRMLSKATVVMTITPEWVRAEEANALFGLPINQVYDLAKTGKIAAKKTDRTNRNSAVIFNVADLRAAIGEMMPYDRWNSERPDLKIAEGA
jgi:hypothetical protein